MPAQCTEVEGFSLHAKVRVDANDRERLERLCRYVTRPPIATERLTVREDGLVVYGLRRPWRDGTSHVVFEPLDFLSRLAALVPPRRAHVLTYHGVLAPAAEWRDEIVPRERTQGHGEVASGCASAAPDSSRSGAAGDVARGPLQWVGAMRRVFALDVQWLYAK